MWVMDGSNLPRRRHSTSNSSARTLSPARACGEHFRCFGREALHVFDRQHVVVVHLAVADLDTQSLSGEFSNGLIAWRPTPARSSARATTFTSSGVTFAPYQTEFDARDERRLGCRVNANPSLWSSLTTLLLSRSRVKYMMLACRVGRSFDEDVGYLLCGSDFSAMSACRLSWCHRHLRWLRRRTSAAGRRGLGVVLLHERAGRFHGLSQRRGRFRRFLPLGVGLDLRELTLGELRFGFLQRARLGGGVEQHAGDEAMRSAAPIAIAASSRVSGGAFERGTAGGVQKGVDALRHAIGMIASPLFGLVDLGSSCRSSSGRRLLRSHTAACVSMPLACSR